MDFDITTKGQKTIIHPEREYQIIPQTQWLNWYTKTCSTYTGSTKSKSCLLHKCLQIAKDLCNTNNSFRTIRLMASHFVAMLTWELSVNGDLLDATINSNAYEDLIKTTVAMAFYDNTGKGESAKTEQFMKVHWLMHAMKLITTNIRELNNIETPKNIDRLEQNSRVLCDTIDVCESEDTQLLIPTVLHKQFNFKRNTYTQLTKEEQQLTIYQRTLKAQTDNSKKAYHFINTLRDTTETSFVDKMTVYEMLLGHMKWSPLVTMKASTTESILIDLETED